MRLNRIWVEYWPMHSRESLSVLLCVYFFSSIYCCCCCLSIRLYIIWVQHENLNHILISVFSLFYHMTTGHTIQHEHSLTYIHHTQWIFTQMFLHIFNWFAFLFVSKIMIIFVVWKCIRMHAKKIKRKLKAFGI